MSSISFNNPYHVLLCYLLTAVPQYTLFQKSFPLRYRTSTTNVSEALEDLNESLEDDCVLSDESVYTYVLTQHSAEEAFHFFESTPSDTHMKQLIP